MKKIILLICALLFTLSCFAQLEKITFKKKFKLIKELRKASKNEEYCKGQEALIDTLYSNITNYIYHDIISNDEILSFLEKNGKDGILRQENMDSVGFGTYQIIFVRRGHFLFGKQPVLNKIRPKYFWSFLEFLEYICSTGQFPSHLAQILIVDLKDVLGDNSPLGITYYFKVHDWDYIEVVRKKFVPKIEVSVGN